MPINKSRMDLNVLSLRNDLLSQKLPPLGPEFSKFDDVVECSDALITHRLLKKLKLTDDKANKDRAANSVAAVLSYDSSGVTSFAYDVIKLDPGVKYVLYNARKKLHEIFSSPRLSFDDLRFPNGESFDSSQGDCSFIAKFRAPKHYRVTLACAELFIKILYNTRWLKKTVKSFFPKMSKSEAAALYQEALAVNDSFNAKDPIGFRCFAIMCYKHVLTITNGARFAVVPKDSETDRVINIECLGNMVVQLCISNYIREVLEESFDVNLEYGQEIHQKMISDPNNATIDWKNASNSNWTSVVEWFFPPRFFALLDAARSHETLWDGKWYKLNMLSPMGNGFTFEVMTCFLLAIGRELDDYCQVYGDDVVIDTNVAYAYINCVEACGWKVNTGKTFITGKFRESCGSFVFDGNYLLSYELEPPEDEFSLMIYCNKLLNLLRFGIMSDRLRDIIQRAWVSAISLVSEFSVRDEQHVNPVNHLNSYYSKCVTSDLTLSESYLEGSLSCIRSYRNAYPLNEGVIISRSMYKRVISRHSGIRDAFKKQLKNPSIVDFQLPLRGVCSVPVMERRPYKNVPLDSVKNNVWIAYYLLNLTIIRPVKGKSCVRYKKHLIFDHMTLES